MKVNEQFTYGQEGISYINKYRVEKGKHTEQVLGSQWSIGKIGEERKENNKL